VTKRDARKNLVEYLTGRRVGRAELNEACQELQADPEYARAVERALGLGASPPLCDLFRARVAEFVELPQSAKLQEMPELAAHYRQCAECRDLYWRVKPTWTESLRGAVHTLVEPIWLAMGSAGELLQEGFGPAALGRSPIFASAAEPDSPGSNRQEWLFELAGKSDRRISLSATSKLPRQVRIVLEVPASGGDWASSARLAVVRPESPESPLVSGRLAFFLGRPILLDAGLWEIQLVSSAEDGAATWVLPITLSPANTGEPE
jgi:hypothetical protein